MIGCEKLSFSPILCYVQCVLDYFYIYIFLLFQFFKKKAMIYLCVCVCVFVCIFKITNGFFCLGKQHSWNTNSSYKENVSFATIYGHGFMLWIGWKKRSSLECCLLLRLYHFPKKKIYFLNAMNFLKINVLLFLPNTRIRCYQVSCIDFFFALIFMLS